MIKKIFKWAGITVGSLLTLIVLFFVVTYFISESHFTRKFNVKGHPIALVNDSASIARGAHLTKAVAKCVECHGDNLAGHIHFNQFGFGRITTPNITMGGVTANFTGDDWERAIRHGVLPDGKPLRFMPADGFYKLTDQEVSDIVAYIRGVPPVKEQSPETSYGFLIRALYVTGVMPLLSVEDIKNHNAPHGEMVPVGITAAYGKHLAEASGCWGCHGEHLSGGPIPGAPSSIPVPKNITPDEATGLGKWSLQDFTHALRDGKRPNGDTINQFMPWKYVGQLNDDEIHALFLYLKSVPPMKFGNR